LFVANPDIGRTSFPISHIEMVKAKSQGGNGFALNDHIVVKSVLGARTKEFDKAAVSYPTSFDLGTDIVAGEVKFWTLAHTVHDACCTPEGHHCKSSRTTGLARCATGKISNGGLHSGKDKDGAATTTLAVPDASEGYCNGGKSSATTHAQCILAKGTWVPRCYNCNSDQCKNYALEFGSGDANKIRAFTMLAGAAWKASTVISSSL
jgi:hypothetical protein